ncbi:hypothetical protein BY996DRAFT_7153746 [Phakopsora pachyrhizi]|nr:hypothetical protein BY996DRAFT_7153746 [Phakopsora pachyrhizi]
MNGSGTRDSKGLNSISSKNHSSLSSPTPTSVVTVVVLQLGVYQTGSASLPVQTPAPILPSDNINNSTVSSPPISNVRLGASGSVLEGSDSRSDSSGGFLKSYHGLSTLGGLLGGIVGLLLVGSAVRAWFSWRERKKNADILDMMAPSSLPERFVTGERDNPRLSSIWTIKYSDRYAHNYSTS